MAHVAMSSHASPPSYRAYVYEHFGRLSQQVQLRTNMRAEPLRATQVRVKVLSAALNPIDFKLIEFGEKFFPIAPSHECPFGIGFDFAGRIVEVGARVKRFVVGDAVYGTTTLMGFGTVAEYVAVDEQFVALKPGNLTFDQSAGVPQAGMISYQALTRHACIKRGDRVLIIGGSCGSGTFAVQIARALGAYVIAATNTRDMRFVRSLGAHQVLDHSQENWTQDIARGSMDCIYDCGSAPGYHQMYTRHLLKRSGSLVTLAGLYNPIVTDIEAVAHQIRSRPSAADLQALTQLIKAGKVVTAIDSIFPFERLVDALKKMQNSPTRGKVILHIADDPAECNWHLYRRRSMT